MKKVFPTISNCLVILVTVLSFPSMTLAQSTQVDFPVHYKSITPLEGSTIERTTIVALRNISQARSDIHRRNLARARHNLVEANRLMETIKDDLSTAPAKNLIRIARKHLEYEQGSQVVHDLAPIYSSLEMISEYLPTDKAKSHIDRAKGFMEHNDNRGADKELALADDLLIVLEVELPLLSSQQYVQKAQGYLAAGNARQADVALKSAEQRMMALYTGMYSPLFQVRQNAWLALRDYSAVGKDQARRYLGQARGHLEKAAAGRSLTGHEEATQLSKEIGELEKKLSGEGKVAESELKATWEKSRALAEREADYLAAGWAKEKATRKREIIMIEAKMHVAYAESYQMTAGEPAQAVRELDKADAYLSKELKNKSLGATVRKKITSVKNKLEQIKISPEKNDAATGHSYEVITEELNKMIHSIETADMVQKMEGSE